MQSIFLLRAIIITHQAFYDFTKHYVALIKPSGSDQRDVKL